MSLTVELHGPRWCVYQDGEEVFSGDFRKVEEWLDQAEYCSKYQESPDGAIPRIKEVGRLSSLIRLRNASMT
jgi:hypothetical protein